MGGLGVLRAVKEEEGDSGGVPAEDGKLRPVGRRCGAKRQRAAGRPYKLFLGDNPLPEEIYAAAAGASIPDVMRDANGRGVPAVDRGEVFLKEWAAWTSPP